MFNNRTRGIWLLGLAILLILLALIATNIGALSLNWWDLWQTLQNPNDSIWHIWLNIRLPRILLAILVGLALAVSGTLIQGIFHNPMADPSLIGINSGASLAVALSIMLFSAILPSQYALYSSMIFAFLGSLVISLLLYVMNRASRGALNKLLLAGIAVNALCFSIVGVLSYISSDQQLRQFSLWTMGNLGQAQWKPLAIAACAVLPATIWALKLGHKLNLLQLGDEEAHYLGVNVAQTKQTILLLSAVLVGSAVAVSGLIGFIGLVIPHLVRVKFGADHRWVLPASAFCGAMLLLVADTVARTLVAPAEIPVGMITGLLGAPYFLWLIIRLK